MNEEKTTQQNNNNVGHNQIEHEPGCTCGCHDTLNREMLTKPEPKELTEEELEKVKEIFAIAVQHIHNSEYADAINKFAEVTAVDPTHEGALNNIGFCLMELQDYQRAFETFVYLVEVLKTDIPFAYYNLARLYAMQESYPTAATYFDKAVKLSTEQTGEHSETTLNYTLERGKVKLLDGDINNALIDFNTVLEVEPENIEALNMRSNCYNELEDMDKAKSDILKVMELAPDFKLAHFNLGLVYKNNDELGEAVSEFSKALNYLENHPIIYLERGLTYILMSEKELAKADLKKSLELDPEMHKARYYLEQIEQNS